MYWFTRILILMMLAAPTLLLIEGTISVGVYCLIVGIALVLEELSDIKDELTKLNNRNR